MKTATIAAIALAACFANLANAGEIRFMEGKGCTENQKGETTDEPGQDINFKKRRGFTNDDAKSVVLFDVREGAVIRVYDDPNGKTSDDWTKIVVKRSAQRLCIGSFERTYEDDFVKVTWHRNNRLNGKVSHVKVD